MFTTGGNTAFTSGSNTFVPGPAISPAGRGSNPGLFATNAGIVTTNGSVGPGVPMNPNSTSPQFLSPTGATNIEGGRLLSSPNITHVVVSTDGRLFFVGANGFLYYRGQDGALHVFGSGQP